jgi:hypothetical protein
MPQGPTPLNPVPRSLLDQFLQELTDLGLTDRQVEGHLVFLRLWQKFLAPQRLLDATPEDLPAFLMFLKENGIKPGEIRLAEEAVEHFYAFTLDRHPTWEERAAWATFFERAPGTREVPMWAAIAKKFLPHLKRVDQGLVDWGSA